VHELHTVPIPVVNANPIFKKKTIILINLIHSIPVPVSDRELLYPRILAAFNRLLPVTGTGTYLALIYTGMASPKFTGTGTSINQFENIVKYFF